MRIEFGEWLPDQADLANPGLVQALNVFPAATSYLPWPSQQPFSNATDTRALGAIQARAADASVSLYVGDTAKLYELLGTEWTDLSKVGGYSVADGEVWEFIKWGEEIIGCCGVDATAGNNIQQIVLGGTQFADLGGSPPQARHITVVRDQVVVGNTYDSTDGLVPNRVRWSGLGSTTDWAQDPLGSQADWQDLQGEGGWVQRVMGGEYGIVFQERAIWRMTYIGPPFVYQFDRVLPSRGTPAPQSVVQVGRYIFFLAQDGFVALIDGVQVQDIGAEKVDRTFFKDLDESYFDRVRGTFDPVNQRVYWAYPGPGNVMGQPNRILCYDWTNNRWTVSDQSLEFMFSASTAGYDMDSPGDLGLDELSRQVNQPANVPNLDVLTESLDSRSYVGGAVELGVIDKDNRLAFWSGAPLQGLLETSERQLGMQRTRITQTRPLVTGGSVQLQIGARNNAVSDSVVWTTAKQPNPRGRITQRSNARYHRFRCLIDGDFTDVQGIDVDTAQGGWR